MTTVREALSRKADQREFHFVIFDGTSATVEPFEGLQDLEPDTEVLAQFTDMNQAFDFAEAENRFAQ